MHLLSTRFPSACLLFNYILSCMLDWLLRSKNEVDPSGTGSYCEQDLGFSHTDQARGHMQELMPTQQ